MLHTRAHLLATMARLLVAALVLSAVCLGALVAARQEPRYARAYVTLVDTDNYVIGVQVLKRSLEIVESKYPLIVMYTGTISQSGITNLTESGCILARVEYIENEHFSENHMNFAKTMVKLNIWNLTDWVAKGTGPSRMCVRAKDGNCIQPPHTQASTLMPIWWFAAM